jgi:hypothetical protein
MIMLGFRKVAAGEPVLVSSLIRLCPRAAIASRLITG